MRVGRNSEENVPMRLASKKTVGKRLLPLMMAVVLALLSVPATAFAQSVMAVVMADPMASDVWIEDASIASIMIQLQAEDLGLGSCWVQVRERYTATGMPSDEFVRGVLDIPLQLQVLSVIAIGHKGMERKPFNEDHLQWEKIHINKFGGK